MHNGGINQFIANSKLDQFMVKNIKNGLANIGAKRNLDLFNELLSKNIQLKESENGYSEQEIIEGYVKFAQRVNPITELLRNQFYQIEQTEPISKLNHSYIGTFTNLEIFPNVNLNE